MPGRTILTLIRHGETSANSAGVWHGSTDTPLSERGLAQAERVARYVHARHGDAAAVYSSHLQRARLTAGAIAELLGLDVLIEEDLGEYHLGSWEGKTYHDLHHEHRLWHHMKIDPDFAPHGGESPRAVTERFTGALSRIAARHAGVRVVVVAHGGALSLGLAQLLDGDYSEWRGVMDNCAVSELRLEPEPQLLSFNETGHLEGL